ncbi:MAG: uracil-DNA glycosylase [Acidobacteriota bacterium]
MPRRSIPPDDAARSLAAVATSITTCERCPRLRAYCARIGREKRAAYRNETYWARPVPGFGDPHARIVLVGLAPAAHGANRTGRVFTGDGVGGSGDFLMTALHAAGLANQPFSRGRDDSLELRDVWIAATVRCAPPDNKPTPAEIANCYPHLVDELAALPRMQVLVALGRIAFDTCWRLLAERGIRRDRKADFAHGVVFPHDGGPAIVASYHPSRQNTQTGRLTPAMLLQACESARSLVR